MIALWISLWWLLGAAVLGVALRRDLNFDRVTVGGLIAFIFAPFIWPFILLNVAIDNDWLDAPVFDRDWFRKDEDEEQS